MTCKFCGMKFYSLVMRQWCESEKCIEKATRTAKLKVTMVSQGDKNLLISIERGESKRKYSVLILDGLWSLSESKENEGLRKDIKTWQNWYSVNTIASLALHYILQADFPTEI